MFNNKENIINFDLNFEDFFNVIKLIYDNFSNSKFILEYLEKFLLEIS